VADLIDRHSARYGVDASLVRAIAWQESGWTQSARSSVGAIGVMQLMPATARWLGTDVIGRRLDPERLEDNIEGGVAFIGWLGRQSGDTRTAIGAYYQGLSSLRSRGPYDDTRAYVANVLSLKGRV
jgi:soluble lytic murein transglycosylase-like protein